MTDEIIGTYNFPRDWPISKPMPDDEEVRLIDICKRISEGESVTASEWIKAEMKVPKSKWDATLRSREKAIVGRAHFDAVLAEERAAASHIKTKDDFPSRLDFLSDEEFFYLEGYRVAPVISGDEREPQELKRRRQLAGVFGYLWRETTSLYLRVKGYHWWWSL